MNRLKKITFVNRYFYPDHSATSQILSDLAFFLASRNYDVEIITSRQKYDNSTAVLDSFEEVNGVRVNRLWTTRFGRQNLVGRALDYLTFYISALLFMLSHLKKDECLVAKTDPPMISIVAAFCCKLKQAKLVNWTQDLFPEVAKALEVRALAPIYRPLLGLRNYSLKSAVRNIVIGERMAERLRAEGIADERIAIVPNWAIEDDIRPIQHQDNPFRSAWNLQNKFVVGYSGNIGRAHEFDTLIATAERLRDKPDIMFLIIGGGAQYEKIKTRIEALGLSNVIFQPYQPREDLQYSLTVADLHVISLLPALEGLIVPSKFYGIAAAGRPVLFIGSTEGEIAKIVKEHDCGRAFEIGDVEAVAAFISDLAANRQRGEEMGHAARRIFEAAYSRQHAFDAWLSVLQQLGLDQKKLN